MVHIDVVQQHLATKQQNNPCIFEAARFTVCRWTEVFSGSWRNDKPDLWKISLLQMSGFAEIKLLVWKSTCRPFT